MTMTEFSTPAGSVGTGADAAGVPVPGDAGAASARRRWTEAERARIVAESERPGATIIEVARRHGIDESTLRGWRRGVLGSVGGAGSGRARRWTEAEKARAVAESERPGVTIAAVARDLGVGESTLARWRKRARNGVSASGGPPPAFVPLVVEDAPAEVPVMIEARGVVVRLPGDSAVDRIVGVAAGLGRGSR